MFNDTYEGEPEWNAENCNRRQGDTTLITCGWCAYRGCGSCRYDCMISGVCSLMKEYGEERNVQWDTPCKIKNLGAIDIESLIKSKKWEIESAKNHIKTVEKEQSILEELLAKAEWKPPQPDSRPCDYYNIGDGVWVFYQGNWTHGTVVAGYRHHDGCVSYILDDYPASKPNEKGPWGCGYAAPGILTDQEYTYFKAVPERFLEWSKMCDRSYNGEKAPMDVMYRALC